MVALFPGLLGWFPSGYLAGMVPMSEIQRYGRAIVRRFEPGKIILFGSHACGQPHEDSDVDVLVVMRIRERDRTELVPPTVNICLDA